MRLNFSFAVLLRHHAFICTTYYKVCLHDYFITAYDDFFM